MSASGSCQAAAKDTAEWKQKAGDDRHHFLLQTFASNGKNRQVENLHAEVTQSLQEVHLLQVKQGDRVLHPFFPRLCLCPREGPLVMSQRAQGSKPHCQSLV